MKNAARIGNSANDQGNTFREHAKGEAYGRQNSMPEKGTRAETYT